MKVPLFVIWLVLLAGCASERMTEAKAIALATQFVAKDPQALALNISQKQPRVSPPTYNGSGMWLVTFSVPPRTDDRWKGTGFGRPHPFTVVVKADGTIYAAIESIP
jgi:hypothetical protein